MCDDESFTVEAFSSCLFPHSLSLARALCLSLDLIYSGYRNGSRSIKQMEKRTRLMGYEWTEWTTNVTYHDMEQKSNANQIMEKSDKFHMSVVVGHVLKWLFSCCCSFLYICLYAQPLCFIRILCTSSLYLGNCGLITHRTSHIAHNNNMNCVEWFEAYGQRIKSS